jgi:ABC-type sugar transport system ATPase subunit
MDNVYLGCEPRRAGAVDVSTMGRQYAELEERTQFGIPPNVLAGSLAIADQQRLEIMRALARDARIIVMDEPTAALTNTESEKLFEVVRRLRESGTTVIYVSHFLQEVLDLSDRVTILRDGKLVRTAIAADETPESLVTSMLGRALTRTFPAKRPPPEDAPVRLKVSGASRARAFQDVSFDVRAGEIVGLAGLVGAGPTALARSLFGADRLDQAEIELDGKPVRFNSPREAIRGGLAYLTESRKDDGLLLDRSATENIALPFLSQVSKAGFVIGSKERSRSAQLLQSVRATAQTKRSSVRELSGGNQQKVLFARWLFSTPRVFIADEPTRGVDVGAKVAIYDLVAELAADGLGVVLISSEHEELIGLAHRVLVMREGRVVAEFRGADINEDNIVTAALIAQGGE